MFVLNLNNGDNHCVALDFLNTLNETFKVNLCNASTSCLTTTWDKISDRLIDKDLCRNNILAYF